MGRRWIITGILMIMFVAVLAAVVLFVLPPAPTPAVAPGSPDESAANAPAGGLITPAEYQSTFVDSPHFLLDVRTPEEFAGGYIDGAVNISLQELADRLNDVPKDQPVVLYCRSGNRSAQAADLLREAGYTQVYDLGGVIQWEQAGFSLIQ
jgi:rhodanese-related sulfurtransferase